MVYDREKFLVYIGKDAFLKLTWENRKKVTMPDKHENVLRALFNSYVLNNSVAMREYVKN